MSQNHQHVGPPQWAVPLLQKVQSTHSLVERIAQKQENLMALVDDLLTKVNEVEATDTMAVQILKDLVAQSANTGSVPDSVLQAALDRFEAANTGLQTEVTTDTPPAPAPSPAPGS